MVICIMIICIMIECGVVGMWPDVVEMVLVEAVGVV